MNTKVWYLPYFEGVYHTRMIETFSSANARMVVYGSYYANDASVGPREENITEILFEIDPHDRYNRGRGQYFCKEVCAFLALLYELLLLRVKCSLSISLFKILLLNVPREPNHNLHCMHHDNLC